MKKKQVLILAMVGSLMLMASSVFANVQNFPVSVTIPSSTDATFRLFQWSGSGPQPSADQGNFNISWADTDLTADLTFSVFRPNFLYFITAAPAGSGNLDIQVDYVDGTAPSGATDTLGDKVVATVVRVEPSTAEININGSTGQTLTSIATASGVIFGGDTGEPLDGGFFKMYIALDPDGTTATPFNFGDPPGSYTGTITLTATPI